MRGDVVTMRLMPRTTYTFTTLKTGGNQTIYMATHIDIGLFYQADFLVRLHGLSASTSSTVLIGIYPDG